MAAKDLAPSSSGVDGRTNETRRQPEDAKGKRKSRKKSRKGKKSPDVQGGATLVEPAKTVGYGSHGSWTELGKDLLSFIKPNEDAVTSNSGSWASFKSGLGVTDALQQVSESLGVADKPTMTGLVNRPDAAASTTRPHSLGNGELLRAESFLSCDNQVVEQDSNGGDSLEDAEHAQATEQVVSPNEQSTQDESKPGSSNEPMEGNPVAVSKKISRRSTKHRVERYAPPEQHPVAQSSEQQTEISSTPLKPDVSSSHRSGRSSSHRSGRSSSHRSGRSSSHRSGQSSSRRSGRSSAHRSGRSSSRKSGRSSSRRSGRSSSRQPRPSSSHKSERTHRSGRSSSDRGNHSSSHRGDRSSSQRTDRSTPQRTDRSTSQRTDRSTSQRTDRSTSQRTDRSSSRRPDRSSDRRRESSAAAHHRSAPVGGTSRRHTSNRSHKHNSETPSSRSDHIKSTKSAPLEPSFARDRNVRNIDRENENDTQESRERQETGLRQVPETHEHANAPRHETDMPSPRQSFTEDCQPNDSHTQHNASAHDKPWLSTPNPAVLKESASADSLKSASSCKSSTERAQRTRAESSMGNLLDASSPPPRRRKTVVELAAAFNAASERNQHDSSWSGEREPQDSGRRRQHEPSAPVEEDPELLASTTWLKPPSTPPPAPVVISAAASSSGSSGSLGAESDSSSGSDTLLATIEQIKKSKKPSRLPKLKFKRRAKMVKNDVVVWGDESIMDRKGHGSCSRGVQDEVRFNVSKKQADKLCCYTRSFAEQTGYWWTKSTLLGEIQANERNEFEFFDSIHCRRVFVVPRGRPIEDFLMESKNHGWPSFRDEEVDWENVRVLKNGETVTVDGAHLGHNLPDRLGNRYCVNLSCIAGMNPASATNGDEEESQGQRENNGLMSMFNL